MVLVESAVSWASAPRRVERREGLVGIGVALCVQRCGGLFEDATVRPEGDGFVVAASHVPGAYEEFSRFVVPELQRRGLFRTAYEGSTLRDSLGLKHVPRREE